MILAALFAALIATPVDVATQLKAAQPGDTVQLVGTFDHVAMKGRTFDPPLTLDLTQATLANLYLDTDQGVTVNGGTFKATPGDWKGALYAVNSARIHVSGVSIDAANGAGVVFRHSADVSLEASRIAGAHNAVALLLTDGFKVKGLDITGMSGDGVDVFSSWRGSVADVSCGGIRAIDASHRDCVQLAPTIAGAEPVSDIEVARVLCFGPAQCVTAFRPDIGYLRIWFHDITVNSDEPQGIALYDGDAASRVENNHAWTRAGAANQTKINVVGGAASHCGNTTGPGGIKPASAEPACPAN